LSEHASVDINDYVLHPVILDCALQGVVALLDLTQFESSVTVAPASIKTVMVYGRCSPQMIAWVRRSVGQVEANSDLYFDIDLLTSNGEVCVKIKDVCFRTPVLKPGKSDVLDEFISILGMMESSEEHSQAENEDAQVVFENILEEIL